METTYRKMDIITLFLNEMRRSDWHDNVPFEQRKYNDVCVQESAQAYSNKVAPLYSDAVVALVKVPPEKYDILLSLIDEVVECQKNFLIPSDETLDAIMLDYNQSNHQVHSLKEDYDYLSFVSDCMKIQKDFLENFKNKFPNIHTNKRETTEDEKKEKTSPIKQNEPIKGVKGLASYLDIGTTKAQDILNCEILQKKGVAYRVGKQWHINPIKLNELLSKEPDILYKRNR